MNARLLAPASLSLPLLLAPLLASAPAHAQAPGAVIVVTPLPPPPAAPPPPPPAVLPPPPACGPYGCVTEMPAPMALVRRPSVMDNRWSIGLSGGGMTLVRDGQSGTETHFGFGELALRYRLTPRFELELNAAGGHEETENGEGDLEVGTLAVAARLRLNHPENRWNWFVMGGLGGAVIARHDATDEEIEDAVQPLGMLGVGLEHRFGPIAIQAELRAIGIGDKDKDDEIVISRSAEPVELPREPSKELGGGSLSVGLSYYF